MPASFRLISGITLALIQGLSATALFANEPTPVAEEPPCESCPKAAAVTSTFGSGYFAPQLDPDYYRYTQPRTQEARIWMKFDTGINPKVHVNFTEYPPAGDFRMFHTEIPTGETRQYFVAAYGNGGVELLPTMGCHPLPQDELNNYYIPLTSGMTAKILFVVPNLMICLPQDPTDSKTPTPDAPEPTPVPANADYEPIGIMPELRQELEAEKMNVLKAQQRIEVLTRQLHAAEVGQKTSSLGLETSREKAKGIALFQGLKPVGSLSVAEPLSMKSAQELDSARMLQLRFPSETSEE